MALLYFPLYHDLFDHKKLKKAENLVDPTGKNNLDRLLVDKMLLRFFSAIFKCGYFMPWNEEVEAEMCKSIGNGMNELWLAPYLKAFLDSNLLSRKMFDEHKILTSRGIQEKWLTISKMIRRDHPVIEEIYYIPELVPEETIVSSRRNHSKHGNKPDINSNSQGNSQKLDTQPAGDHVNNGFPPEETQVPSRSNTGTFPNQGGVSPSTTTIQESIDNTIIVVEGNVPEETIVNSGSNANNSTFGTEETGKFPKKPEFVPEETTDTTRRNPIRIEASSTQLYTIDDCLWNYFHNRAFERTREQHLINWGVGWSLEVHQQWAAAFNRSKLSDGILECAFNGTNGWLRNIKNWVMKINNYKQVDPNTLFTVNDINYGNKQQGSQSKPHSPRTGSRGSNSKIGGVSSESVEQLFNRKRK